MTADSTETRPADSEPVTCLTLGPGDKELWPQILGQLSPEQQFIHSEWPELLEKTYRYKTYIVAAMSGEKLIASLPVVSVSSLLTGKRGISLPFFDHCGNYSSDPKVLEMLVSKAKETGKKLGWRYLELRGETRSALGNETSLEFYNHVVDLSQGSEAAFDNLASSNRRAIRKAHKEGLEVEISQDIRAMKGFYRLQCITRRRHGLPPQPFKFFHNVHQSFIANGRGCIVSAKLAGKTIASGVYIEQGDTVHYKYGASDLDFQNARCNNLVMWSAIEYFANRGFCKMDLGRNSIDNEGLRRYKKSWGCSEKVIHYQRVCLKTDRIMLMSDDVYGWHNRIFAHLPTFLSRWAGSIIYRHIA